ncbi:hypothetical protein JOH50_005107 [Rhizobium leguminosarum]|nr:hypothetical protein [Rhizobium leguminosarum]
MRSRTNIAPPLRPDFRRSISRTTASLPSQPSGRPLRRRWPMRHPHPLRLGYESRASAGRLTLAGFKTMMQEQYFVLLIDEPGSWGNSGTPAGGHGRAPKGLRGPARAAGVVGRWKPAGADCLDRVAELFSLGKEEFGSNPVRGPASKSARVRNAS